LNRLKLRQHGQVIGAKLPAFGQSVALALMVATGRDGYHLLHRASLRIKTACMHNADEEGEQPTPQCEGGYDFSLMCIEAKHGIFRRFYSSSWPARQFDPNQSTDAGSGRNFLFHLRTIQCSAHAPYAPQTICRKPLVDTRAAI